MNAVYTLRFSHFTFCIYRNPLPKKKKSALPCTARHKCISSFETDQVRRNYREEHRDEIAKLVWKQF